MYLFLNISNAAAAAAAAAASAAAAAAKTTFINKSCYKHGNYMKVCLKLINNMWIKSISCMW